MSVTQQEPMTLPAIEQQVAQLEAARAAAMADHGQALYHADGETMVAASRLVERLTTQRASLLAPRIHARKAQAECARDAAAATLATAQATAQAADQELADAIGRLAALNPLDSDARCYAAQSIDAYEVAAIQTESELTAARQRFAVAAAWTHELTVEARRLDVSARETVASGVAAERRATIDRDERRAASSLSSAATLLQSIAAHQDACLEGLRLSERETAATRDRLTTARRLIAGGNVLDPVRHQREAELPALERAIREAEEQEGVAQRRYAAASRQLRDAKADQAALVERHAQRLPLFVRTLDDLLDAGMGIERALTMADEAVR